MKNHGKEGILIAIFDPNRKVDPTFLFYEVATNSGEVVMGAIANETPTAITMKQPHGEQMQIMKTNIKKMTAHKESMMPEGLEASLKAQDVADLLEYVVTVE